MSEVVAIQEEPAFPALDAIETAVADLRRQAATASVDAHDAGAYDAADTCDELEAALRNCERVLMRHRRHYPRGAL